MSRDVDFQKAVELSGEINHHVRVRQSLNTYRWKLHGIIKVLCDSLGDFEAGVEQHSAEITKLLSERDAIHAIFNDRFTPKVASGMIVAAKETASEECVGVRDEFTGSEEDASLIRGVSLIQHIVSGGIMDIPEVRDEKILRVPMPMLPRDLPTHAENSDIQSAMLAHSLWGAVRAAGAVEEPAETIADTVPYQVTVACEPEPEVDAVTAVEPEKAQDEQEPEVTTVVAEVEKDDGHPVAIELGEITSKDVDPEVLNGVNEATVLPPVTLVDIPRVLPDEPVSVETGENDDRGDFPVKASEEIVESDNALIVEPVRHDAVDTDDLIVETASTGHGVHTSTGGDVGATVSRLRKDLTEDGAVDGKPEPTQELLDDIGDTFDAAPSHKDDEFPFDTIAREQKAEQKDVEPEVPAVVESEVVEKPAEPEPEKVETAVRKPKKISFKPKTKAKLKVHAPEAPPEAVEPKPETSVADAAPVTQDAPPVMDESEYGQDDVPENIPDDDEPEDVSGDDVMSQQRPRLNIRRKPIFSN